MAAKAKDSGGEYEPVLLPSEAAERLRIDIKTLNRWTLKGWVGSLVLPSGHHRYRVSDIENCLLPYRAAATPKPPSRKAGQPKRLPGARQGHPRTLQAGVKRPRSRLAAPETSPGARLAQPASHQRGTTAGLVAARAPGGLTPITYGGRS